MKLQALLITLLVLLSQTATAMDRLPQPQERFVLHFEMFQGQKSIEWGRSFVSTNPGDWSKGLQRSYLQLRCAPDKSGKQQKLISTINHFDGLRLKHQIQDGMLNLTLIRSKIKPRYTEIHALPKNECQELIPIVDTVSETYSLRLDEPLKQVQSFGNDMSVHFTFLPLAKAK